MSADAPNVEKFVDLTIANSLKYGPKRCTTCTGLRASPLVAITRAETIGREYIFVIERVIVSKDFQQQGNLKLFLSVLSNKIKAHGFTMLKLEGIDEPWQIEKFSQYGYAIHRLSKTQTHNVSAIKKL